MAYVAFITDVFARKIVSWRVSTSISTGFVLDALNQTVGSVGDSYENAMAETIIGQFKAEVTKLMAPWKTVGSAISTAASFVRRTIVIQL